MLSKSKIKLISSLSQKKNRDELNLFVAEGSKLVLDLSKSFECVVLAATSDWFQKYRTIETQEKIELDEQELKRITNQKTPQGVLAVFKKPIRPDQKNISEDKLYLALDDIQDPGNLGTIIRVADWFGITDIFCSEQTVDAFGPKVVQATMGALARVRIHVVNLSGFLASIKRELPVYGTFMNGDNIYTKTLSAGGIIVMGNEGNGIGEGVEKNVTEKLLLPNFPVGSITSESLNVGVATALICAEFRRRQL